MKLYYDLGDHVVELKCGNPVTQPGRNDHVKDQRHSDWKVLSKGEYWLVKCTKCGNETNVHKDWISETPTK